MKFSISEQIFNVAIASIFFGMWVQSWMAGVFMMGTLSAIIGVIEDFK
jgi:hypothetical protein